MTYDAWCELWIARCRPIAWPAAEAAGTAGRHMPAAVLTKYWMNDWVSPPHIKSLTCAVDDKHPRACLACHGSFGVLEKMCHVDDGINDCRIWAGGLGEARVHDRAPLLVETDLPLNKHRSKKFRSFRQSLGYSLKKFSEEHWKSPPKSSSVMIPFIVVERALTPREIGEIITSNIVFVTLTLLSGSRWHAVHAAWLMTAAYVWRLQSHPCSCLFT